MTSHLAKSDRYRAGNHEAAEITLADIDHYGGEGALPVVWARLILGSDTFLQNFGHRPAGRAA